MLNRVYFGENQRSGQRKRWLKVYSRVVSKLDLQGSIHIIHSRLNAVLKVVCGISVGNPNEYDSSGFEAKCGVSLGYHDEYDSRVSRPNGGSLDSYLL